MKLFLDTADIESVQRAAATGLLRGVTTNPTHVLKTGERFESVVRRICELVPEHVSAEAVADTTDDLVREAERISQIADQIVVKIPMTRAGLAAVQRLEERGIRTNVTMVFSATQAHLAMSAGASFVSLVLSRLEKVGQEVEQFISDAAAVRDRYGFESEIIGASLKTQPTFLTCLRCGVDIATIPESLFDQLWNHPLTDAGLAAFEKDWNQLKTEELV